MSGDEKWVLSALLAECVVGVFVAALAWAFRPGKVLDLFGFCWLLTVVIFALATLL